MVYDSEGVAIPLLASKPQAAHLCSQLASMLPWSVPPPPPAWSLLPQLLAPPPALSLLPQLLAPPPASWLPIMLAMLPLSRLPMSMLGRLVSAMEKLPADGAGGGNRSDCVSLPPPPPVAAAAWPIAEVGSAVSSWPFS